MIRTIKKIFFTGFLTLVFVAMLASFITAVI